MERNFEFDGLSVIRWHDGFIDLHNAYDLEAFGTDMNGTAVALTFARNLHAIRPDLLPLKVKLRCSGNVRLAFNDLTAIAAPLDHEGIEIAYFNEDCDWSSFVDEDLAKQRKPQGLFVSFINGLIVRIYCDQTSLDILDQ